jgi:hypothetical protein
VAQVDGSGEHLIARGFGAIRGIGPVWSPTGDRIVYQRMTQSGESHHAVVLVTPDGESEVVLPDVRLPGDPDGSGGWSPCGVMWSPDGTQLLYAAWLQGAWPEGTGEHRALIAVPINRGSAPVLLEDEAPCLDRDGGAPIQMWGRARG